MKILKVNERNQWQLKGDCSICRKQKYCTKQCQAFKKNIYKEVERIFLDRIGRC